MERRISSRGSLTIAGQRIQIGMVHAGRTVTVETADTTWRIYHDDELLTEVPRAPPPNPSPGSKPESRNRPERLVLLMLAPPAA